MEHIYFEAQLCSEIATLKESPKNKKHLAGEVFLIVHFRQDLMVGNIPDVPYQMFMRSTQFQSDAKCYCDLTLERFLSTFC